MSDELPIPYTGELVPLTDAVRCAKAIEELRQLEAEIRTAKTVLAEAIGVQAGLLGERSFPLGDGRVAKVGPPRERRVDPSTLAEKLRLAGAPEALIDEIIVAEITYRVDLRRVDRAAKMNPKYAAALEAATRWEEVPQRITIERTKG